jgi:CheY-like chemotaxis protein
VWNLLSNAVKFTGHGGTVDVELSDTSDGGVSICVKDNGIGLDPALLPHVFERFWQADSSNSRRHGGLGLGLAIARHLVELHGGVIRAESAGLGAGCTFTIGLPQSDPSRDLLPAAPEVSSHVGSTASLQGCRVLVVDDEEDGREMVAAILRRAGANVQLAASATDALTYLDQRQTDVLLADLAMPVVDGYELVRRVRARDQHTGSRLPAAAITAYAGAEDRARALGAGFDRHLAKPVVPAVIIDAVEAMWRGGSQAPGPTPQAT